jgi:hypothetical protein
MRAYLHQLRLAGQSGGYARPLIPPDSGTAPGARSEHHAHRLRLKSARHEREHLRRDTVEPLLVIDETDQRLLLRHVRQEAQRGKADKKPIRR